jgi:hypothetical protein
MEVACCILPTPQESSESPLYQSWAIILDAPAVVCRAHRSPVLYTSRFADLILISSF